MNPRLRVLVTGAGGFVGRALCQELTARGHQVLAMARHASSDWPAAVEPWLVADLAELGSDAAERLRGIDAVVHCAARAHKLQDRAADPLTEFRKTNLDASLRLAELAAAAGVTRFIHLSSIGVNGSASPERPFRRDDAAQPLTPYARSKWEAEQALDALAQRSGMATVHLRAPLIYGRDAPGNFGLLWRAVRSGVPLPLGGLHEPRSFIALDNLVDLIAHLLASKEPARGVHLVSDGEDLSTAAFVRAMAVAAALPARVWPLPAGLLRAAAGVLGRGDQVHKMAVRLQVDSSSLREQLGWTPPYRVDQALRKALAPAPNSTKGKP